MRVPGLLFVNNLVARRALIAQLVRRDFEQRYVGSVAGWIWGLIHPLVMILSFTFVFQICMKVQTPKGSLTESYVLFLLAGILPWWLFQETVQRAATSMVDHANLITKTLFPSEIIPVSIFLSTLINHLFVASLVVLAILWAEHHISVNLLLLPVYMLLTGLFAVGVGWIAASLQVYLRDTAQIVSVITSLWFWLTPIMISETDYPPSMRFLVVYNPFAYLVRAYRDRLLSANLPDAGELGVIAAVSAASFFVGGLFFRHLKRGFADVL